MAKSPQLVHAIAKVIKKPDETVRVALRRLHEAGLIEVTGRGRGGKDMTARDAAMLLLAMSMGTMLKDSPATIQEYWNLPLDPNDVGPAESGSTPGGRIPALNPHYFAKLFTKRLSPVDTLGTVLSRIIDCAVQGTLFPLAERTDFAVPPAFHHRSTKVPFAHLHVRIYSPRRAASIRTEINMQWNSELRFGDSANKELMALSSSYWLAEADYLEIRQFSHTAILTIGESLR
jgi:hypothetical protein